MKTLQARYWEIDTENDGRIGTSVFVREETSRDEREPRFLLEGVDSEHCFSLDELAGVAEELRAFVLARRAERRRSGHHDDCNCEACLAALKHEGRGT